MNSTVAIVLICTFAWTTAFSLTNRFPLRGLRNLGILASYLSALIMSFVIGVKDTIIAWAVCGIVAGVLYIIYDVVARTKCVKEEKPAVSFMHVPYGLLAWPIMGPEAIEYLLAEFGFLKQAEEPNKQASE